MCEKFKYKDYQVVGSVSEVQYQWLKADAAERQLVLSLLPTIIEEQEGDGDYSWQGYELELVDGSSLYEVHMLSLIHI